MIGEPSSEPPRVSAATTGAVGIPPDGRLTSLRPVLLALAVVVLIFTTYELIERTWLTGSEAELLRRLHWLRGLLSAGVAVALVWWLLARPSQALLTTPPQPRDWSRGSRPGESERLVHFAEWFIRMRWIAVLATASLVVLAVRVADVLAPAAWWPLVITVTGLAGLNALYVTLLRRGHAGRTLLSVQAYLDLCVLTILLHFSGGAANPLSMLMLFHVIIAGIVLERPESFVVAGTGSILFALLVWAESSGVLQHYPLDLLPPMTSSGELLHVALTPLYAGTHVVLHAVVLFVTAYFATGVADRIREDEHQLENFADRLLTQSQLLERALETTGTGLCVRDREGRRVWGNRIWEEWHLSDLPAAASPPAADDPRDPDARAAEATLKDGIIRVTETAHPADGRTFLVTTAPLLTSDGGISHVVELAQEITSQKLVQARLIQAEKLAAIGRLSGQVAHEVNNPIGIISAKTRLLLADHGDELSERTATELTKIIDLADRVARIAGGLLSYARPSAAARVLLDPRAPIRQALTMIEPMAKAAGVHTVDRLPASTPSIQGNAGELEQVFLNLFLNAVDAMPDGGRLAVSARIEDAAAVQPGLIIEVEDTGIGIPEEIRDRLFEPFLTTKPPGKGTGLGLSICLGLIRSHGGRIDIDSEAGRGTRVLVHLPLRV